MGAVILKQSGRRGWGESIEHFVRLIENDDETTLTGNVMSVTLHRLVVNARLPSKKDSNKILTFTMLEVELQNLTDYQVSTLWTSSDASLTMIDTQGFQHFFYNFLPEYCDRIVVAGGMAGGKTKTEIVELRPSLDGKLEGRTRTRGWVGFDALPEGVFPARIIYRANVSDPPGTSGVIAHKEILEFEIPKADVVTRLGLLS